MKFWSCQIQEGGGSANLINNCVNQRLYCNRNYLQCQVIQSFKWNLLACKVKWKRYLFVFQMRECCSCSLCFEWVVAMKTSLLMTTMVCCNIFMFLWISFIRKSLFHFKSRCWPSSLPELEERASALMGSEKSLANRPTRDRQKTQLELLNIFVLNPVPTMSFFYIMDSMLKLELLLFSPHGTLYLSSLQQYGNGVLGCILERRGKEAWWITDWGVFPKEIRTKCGLRKKRYLKSLDKSS